MRRPKCDSDFPAQIYRYYLNCHPQVDKGSKHNLRACQATFFAPPPKMTSKVGVHMRVTFLLFLN